MATRSCLPWLLFLLVHVARACAQDIPDQSPIPYVFESTSIHLNEDGTINTRYMPTVGNGHLATFVYSDALHINGLYNGRQYSSHRARVQAIHALKPSFVDVENSTLQELYSLDARRGVYQETLDGPNATATYRTYAHQFYNRLLVTEVELKRKTGIQGNIVLELSSLMGNSTDSLTLGPAIPYGNHWYQNGTIKETETDWSERTEVHIYWSVLPSSVELADTETEAKWYYFMSIDVTPSAAQADFDEAIRLTNQGQGDVLLTTHSAAWEAVWNDGRIEVEGNLELSKTIWAALYYIYSNLPSQNTHQKNNLFNGLSPGGLANGGDGIDYWGHVFWDMETWMYPSMLLLNSNLAKDMLAYRMSTMEQAYERARDGQYDGTQYPWESAFTGVETAICIPCRDQQHITGDIAFAARQYISSTRDLDWLTSPQNSLNLTGYDFIKEMSRFWYSRPSYNITKMQYEINGVMPPDEYHPVVNNSVYTNVIAALSVHFGRYAACLAGLNPETEIPERWLNVVENLHVPFNREKRYHEEFENYDNLTAGGRTVKQADVVLLGFPLMWDMPPDVRYNDLDYYENVTVSDGPAMTWSMHAIGWLEQRDLNRAAAMFNRSYQPYTVLPYRIWTEVAGGLEAVNFQTGMGGFLQGVMFGYGSVRLRVERLDFPDPQVPPESTSLRLVGLDYIGSTLNVHISGDTVTVTLTSAGNRPLLLYIVAIDDVFSLVLNEDLIFARGAFSIYTAVSSGCPLPKDHINIDYGNNVFTSQASRTTQPWILPTIVFLFVTLYVMR